METAMPSAMLILVGCQLLGELLRTTFHLPVPGPVIGMFLLTLAPASAQNGSARPSRPRR